MSQNFADHEIIEAFRSADPAAHDRAWEFIYKNWGQDVIKAIVRRGGQREDARDAIHEIAIRFQRGVSSPGFVLTSRLYFYFFVAVRRKWATQQAKEGRMIKIEIEEAHLAAFADDMEAPIYQTELRAAVHTSLGGIGLKCQKLLLLWSQGLSMLDIAQAMGYANANVAKSRKEACLKAYLQFINDNPLVKNHLERLKND